MENILDDFVQQVQSRKEQLIIDRLKELIDPEFDLETELCRRFPRLKCERTGGRDYYYWDDGTFHGKLIIVFDPPSFDQFDSKDLCYTINVTVPYKIK